MIERYGARTVMLCLLVCIWPIPTLQPMNGQIRIQVLATFWTICGRPNSQHTDANLLKRFGFTWIAGINNERMQTGFVFTRLTYLFKLFNWGKSANGFITNYLPYLRTSLYATVITLFLYPDFHYSPILKNDRT